MSDMLGQCAEVTLELAQKDSSLTRVRGHYICPVWGRRGHWWLKTKEGKVFDPTAEQFPSKGGGEYIEWIEGAEEPTGICMGCGTEVFRGNYCCSEGCESMVMEDFR